jgi:hypothetical protein
MTPTALGDAIEPPFDSPAQKVRGKFEQPLEELAYDEANDVHSLDGVSDFGP